MSVIVVKNISVHLKELLIEFKINSLWLVLIFQVLKVKALCEFVNIIAQKKCLMDVFLDKLFFALLNGCIFGFIFKFLRTIYFSGDLIFMIVVMGAFLSVFCIFKLIIVIAVNCNFFRIFILELIDELVGIIDIFLDLFFFGHLHEFHR